jgi:hypothetical protein
MKCSVTLQNGRKIAADGLDELFLGDELHDMPRELHMWVAGVNKREETNKVEISLTPLSILLKVWGHDKAWVEAEYQRIATIITGLQAACSERVRTPQA